MDINIKQIRKQPFKNLQSSKLILQLTGKTVNHSLVNTLRRICIQNIPTYAACKKSITIDKNTSIFDNDYMKLRLSQMTIPNIKNNIVFLDEKYWNGVDYEDPNRIKHPDDNTMIELYVNAVNNTNENMNVTTNDAKLLINSELVERFDKKYSSLLIQLKPGQEFSCRCVHVLGTGKANDIWTGGNIFYEYDEKDEHDFIMTLESQGQMDEYELLCKACLILKRRNDIIRKKMKREVAEGNMLKIILDNEDPTMAELINTLLQDHDKVEFSGVNKPNMLIDSMVIVYSTTAKESFQPVYETLDLIDRIADTLLKKFMVLGKDYIDFEM